jgi:PAS domain S-box-containing protein
MRTAPPDLARSALDAAPDAMIILDAAGIIQFTNRQVSAVFGYEHDEIIGQSIETLLPERFRARHIVHREHYVSSIRTRPMGAGLALFGRRKDGSEFPVEISLSPIEDRSRTLIAAAIRDVTDRKRIEAELIVAREAAESARESADRANQGKSRFLATASHDLRQPLQTLELLNGSLRRRATDRYSIDALMQQEQAIGSMSRLLSALLDISKLESGAVKPELGTVAVAALFEELRVEFESVAAHKGLKLEIETSEATVYTDPSLLEQIFRNLVSNAIKYTREGEVRLRSLKEGDAVRVEVLDTGVGIPADQLTYIYDEFYQVGVPANASRDGYGLGLAIVHRLVKLLAIQLDVRSEVGKGSVFSVVLPASSEKSTDNTVVAGCDPASPPPLGEARVLIVEDNESVRRATSMLLELEGYHVTPVGSLAEALKHVHQGSGVDLLITDYHLRDGETGTQVIASLREILGTSLKVVLTTGDTSSVIKQLPRDPCLRVTSKPVRSDELLTLMRTLLAG